MRLDCSTLAVAIASDRVSLSSWGDLSWAINLLILSRESGALSSIIFWLFVGHVYFVHKKTASIAKQGGSWILRIAVIAFPLSQFKT